MGKWIPEAHWAGRPRWACRPVDGIFFSLRRQVDLNGHLPDEKQMTSYKQKHMKLIEDAYGVPSPHPQITFQRPIAKHGHNSFMFYIVVQGQKMHASLIWVSFETGAGNVSKMVVDLGSNLVPCWSRNAHRNPFQNLLNSSVSPKWRGARFECQKWYPKGAICCLL